MEWHCNCSSVNLWQSGSYYAWCQCVIILWFFFTQLVCFLILIVVLCSSELRNLRLDSQSHCNQKRRMKNWTIKMMMNMERPCVGHVVNIMALMNSGFVVTSVRSGSMVNAWRSPLLGQSISSNTSAHHAVTRELAPDWHEPSSIIDSHCWTLCWSCYFAFLPRCCS